MARSYEEATAGRQARLPPDARRQSEAFAGAYDLAVQLSELREQRGITQAELAAATGLNQADISRIERGAANPTERTLLRIAHALDADLRLVERPASLSASAPQVTVVGPRVHLQADAGPGQALVPAESRSASSAGVRRRAAAATFAVR